MPSYYYTGKNGGAWRLPVLGGLWSGAVGPFRTAVRALMDGPVAAKAADTHVLEPCDLTPRQEEP